MEVIIELLVEVVLQVVFELLADAGLRGIGKLLSNRWSRLALVVGVSAGLAYGGGWWWGDRLSDTGRTALPSAFAVSIGLAVVFGGLALVRGLAQRTDERQPGVGDAFEAPGEVLPYLSPLRWPPLRLVGFAILNVAIAAGVHAGFTPDRVLG